MKHPYLPGFGQLFNRNCTVHILGIPVYHTLILSDTGCPVFDPNVRRCTPECGLSQVLCKP